MTSLRLQRYLVVPCLFLLLLLLAGCTGEPNQTAPQTPAPVAGTGPGLTITAPADGAVLPAGDITISVQVTNFKLVSDYGQAFVPGEGHLHYYKDLPVLATERRPAVTPPGSFVATTATSYTFTDVPPGMHTFTVELASNDHTPFIQPVNRTVTVTVAASPSPAATGTVSGGGPDVRSCATDADCVPEQCCHPSGCINRAYKQVCTVLCTNVCLGPIDCGAAHCGCVSGSCGIVPGPGPTP
jgi:hypothetical protein